MIDAQRVLGECLSQRVFGSGMCTWGPRSLESVPGLLKSEVTDLGLLEDHLACLVESP